MVTTHQHAERRGTGGTRAVTIKACIV